jgi:hypothetical protein
MSGARGKGRGGGGDVGKAGGVKRALSTGR